MKRIEDLLPAALAAGVQIASPVPKPFARITSVHPGSLGHASVSFVDFVINEHGYTCRVFVLVIWC